ncbi:PEGA domain-containing protein [Sessilibacter sp. MAH1]
MDNKPSIKRIQAAQFTPTAAVETKSGFVFKPIYGVIAALFLIVLVSGWYLISARSLIIYTNPIDAEVNLEGGFHLKLGDSYLLLPGQYQAVITHQDYFTLSSDITVSSQENQTIELNLAPLPGSLKINLAENTEIEVFIDGEKAQVTENLIIKDISAGEHRYTITSARFQNYSDTVIIEGKRIQQSLDVSLVPAWADVSVNSLPEGAEIYADGELLGKTPASVELLQGDRDIVLKLSGYKDKTYPLTVKAQEDQKVGTLVLEKIDGQIQLTSSPQGASVTIDGFYVGQTPITAPVTPKNGMRVRFFKDGYQSVSKSVSVKSGDKINLSANLPELLGLVRISANPSDALLYVDGRLSGRASQSLKLPARQTRITIKKEGYADYSTAVIPHPELTQNVSVQLKTLEEAKWENVKQTITAADGQTLKLFRPNDTFTMGASRREQGRRSNETLRTVQLTRPFYMATTETTNAQFKQFQATHSSSHVSGNSLDNDQLPVVNVSWVEAAKFCNWLSQQENLPLFYNFENDEFKGFNSQSNGYRLPTEAEWAWVARFKDGDMLRYSWGDALPPPDKSENIADRSAASILGVIQAGYDDGYIVTSPVKSFAANHNGLFDINGNVSEWISDFYLIKTGISSETEVDPLGPAEGDFHVIRGSSWSSGGISDLRLSYREYGNDRKNTIGFRIARFLD